MRWNAECTELQLLLDQLGPEQQRIVKSDLLAQPKDALAVLRTVHSKDGFNPEKSITERQTIVDQSVEADVARRINNWESSRPNSKPASEQERLTMRAKLMSELQTAAAAMKDPQRADALARYASLDATLGRATERINAAYWALVAYPELGKDASDSPVIPLLQMLYAGKPLSETELAQIELLFPAPPAQ